MRKIYACFGATILAIIVVAIVLNNKIDSAVRDFHQQQQDEADMLKLASEVFVDPKEDLMDALKFYNIMYPEIVYSQAVLETGHFESKVFREYNNLFGLYNSAKGDYCHYDHWVESVVAYKRFIENKYTTEKAYMNFLKTLPYSTADNYIDVLKKIEANRFWEK